ncbi:hypothetical protein ACFVYE_32025 [Streptomyces sp. NPDC058239]|uniref:hypothetical protein n=1 Tax=Streptomyces sp. NPDC058239 TaxID=3346395 RepID=UPI0036E8E0E7
MNVETLSNDYDEGEKSLSKAMRALVEDAYVVKFKIQRATTETVIEDGKEVVKRGGSWYTTFTVDSIPFTAADVAAMVEEIYAEGNVKSHRVEPTRLDPKKASSAPSGRPTPPGGGVGPTRGNAASNEGDTPGEEARPTPPSGAPGRPTPGEGGAHIRKKTTSARAADEHLEDESEAPSGRSPVDVRRTSTSGSSAREAEGGCAASGKTSPFPEQHDDTDRPARGQRSGSKKDKHTREQLTLVAAVRAHFPAEFLGGLPDVPTLSQAVLDALAGDVPAADRTVEQLGARIQQRWNHHGWAEKYYAGKIDSLVGAAVAMVRPLKAGDRYGCANPRCEAGVDVDSKEECQTCPARLEARKAQRAQDRGQDLTAGANSAPAGTGSSDAAMPPQRSVRAPASPPLECDGRDGMCGRPPERGSSLCQVCLADAAEQHDIENAGAPAPF